MTDGELLQQYVQSGSEGAFKALMMKYLDFVYSCAKRQVRSDAAAQDVSQSVFIELAAKAKSLRPDSHLGSWLHVVTKGMSIDSIRREASRGKREAESVHAAAQSDSGPDWDQMRPLLDEAISSLSAGDRTAVLLRFFENKSFSEMGLVLGVSDDTAQKRLTRAIERLRREFSSRGIQVTAAGLTAAVLAHGVEAAPAGVALAVSAAVSASGALSQHLALINAANHFTMTITQKTLALAALAAAIGGGLYQQDTIHRQSGRVAALERQVENDDKLLASFKSSPDSNSPQSRGVKTGLLSAQANSSRGGALPNIDPRARLEILADLQGRKMLNAKMVFVDPVGKLSPTFVDLFSLTTDEQNALQNAVDEGRRQMGVLMAANATVTSTGSNNVTISVKPLDGGPAVGDGVMNAFASVLGSDRNAAFLALGSTQLEEALGNFGAEEETISITNNGAGGSGQPAGYAVSDTRVMANHMQLGNISYYSSLEEVTNRWPIAPLVPKGL